MCSSLVLSCSSSEAATITVLKKKVFLKILQHLQENTCPGVSFLALLFVPCGEIWLRWIHQLTPMVGHLL